MVDQELLKILVCPENKTPVALVDDDVVAKANSLIEAGNLKNRGGDNIDKKIDAALIREDKTYMYPIRDDIPIMLIDEAIPMEQLS